jgi:uncharacterized protein YchJ
MRSRYSAYALAQGRGAAHPALLDYLMKTWHPSTAPADLALGPMNWTGLEVLRRKRAATPRWWSSSRTTRSTAAAPGCTR